MANRSFSRHTRPLTGPSLVLLLLGVSACDSDASNPPGGPGGGDGGGGASSGAGGDGAGGAEVGGGGDAGGGGSSSSSLTVRTVDSASGEPLPDVPVVVSNADGSLAASAISGADGNVTVTIPAAGFVSVLRVHDELTTLYLPALRTVHEVRTFYPAQGADLLEVRLKPSDFVPEEPMSVSFDIPSMEGVTHYGLILSCGVSGSVAAQDDIATLTGYWGCPGQDTFDAILTGYNSEGAPDGWIRPVVYAVQKDVPFAPGTDALIDFELVDAPLTEVPFELHGVFGDEMRVSLESVAGPSGAPRFADGFMQEPARKEFAVPLRAATDYASSYCYSIQWRDDTATKPTGEAGAGCSDQLPALVELQGGRLAMPSMEATPGSASFSVPADGEPGDGLVLQAQRGMYDEDSHWRWSAVRELSAAGSFVFPELPSDQAAFGFGGQPDTGSFPQVALNLSHVDLLDVTEGFVQTMASAPTGAISATHPIELAFASAFLR
jgi:hypothetical protein